MSRKPDYSFNISFKVVRESERERKLLEIAKEYKVQPGAVLIQKMIDDFYKIEIERAKWKAEALKQREEADAVLLRLKVGE